MTRPVTIEFFLTPDCNSRAKIGFTSGGSKDSFLNRQAERIAQAVEAGQIRAIMADWSADEVTEAQPYLRGEKAPADVPGYEVVTCYFRVRQQLEGSQRDGTTDVLSDVLGLAPASDAPFAP